VTTVDVVIPSAGRPSLRALLEALAPDRGAFGRVIVVDDGGRGVEPFVPGGMDVTVIAGAGRGPAAARNAGWRAADAEWVAFLDDDVVPQPGWAAALAADLEGVRPLPSQTEAGGLTPAVGGSQGRIEVPLPAERRPTDWERNVAGLQDAVWATADLAYRREALAAVGGFDERFPRAYREDSDLGLRMRAAGWEIARGARRVTHPVGPADAAVSLRKQAGNADDALMDALHGPGWRERAGAPAGRRRRHLAVAASGAVAAAPRVPRAVRAAALAGWAAGTAELAWRRIAPGPRTPREVATMLWTSAAMPFAATGWWLAGKWRARGARALAATPAAVLFDRDGTLVVDVPYNGDPERVELVPGAREAIERVRRAGVPTAVVSNQSGIARGLLTPAQVHAVNARVEELLGTPLGPWTYCPHGPEDGCACRKPAPGLVLRAASELGVEPGRCVVIGDIGADVEAAAAAGARGILVPTPRTRREEVEAAPEVAPDLVAAVELALGSAA
jgi:histidinol-phosphate phosphatase family protein